MDLDSTIFFSNKQTQSFVSIHAERYDAENNRFINPTTRCFFCGYDKFIDASAPST